jgi:universal stress protein A
MQLHRILCPVDFSECSLRAADYAFQLAQQFRAAVEIVHVWQPIVPGGEIRGPMSAYVGEEAEIGRALERIRPRSLDVSCQHHLLVGDPVEEIVALAEEHHVDLIVIGTHGRTGLSRWIVGSVAENVLRRATCPVLTVKHLPIKEPVYCVESKISFAT